MYVHKIYQCIWPHKYLRLISVFYCNNICVFWCGYEILIALTTGRVYNNKNWKGDVKMHSILLYYSLKAIGKWNNMKNNMS